MKDDLNGSVSCILEAPPRENPDILESADMPGESPSRRLDELKTEKLEELRSLHMVQDVRVSACAMTDPGNVRSINEDNFLVSDVAAARRRASGEPLACRVGPEGVLLAVADGMGGNLAGEVASELALHSLAEEWAVRARRRPIEDELREAVTASNERVWSAWQHNPEWNGMATTLTAVLISGRTAHVVEVGDSRCYLVRRNTIKQVTRDQSVAELLIDIGKHSPETPPEHITGGRIVLQAIGLRPTVDAAETSLDLRRDDWLILCSDGLYGQVSDDEIRDVVVKLDDPREICAKLIGLAKDRGAPDNVTVVVAQVTGPALGLPDERERVTGTLKMLHAYDPLGNGDYSLDDVPLLAQSHRRRRARAHAPLLLLYGTFLLLAVGYIFYKIVSL